MASQILNFSPSRLITGINIIDGMLFFTDNEMEPKKINIDQFRNDEPNGVVMYGNAEHSSGTTVIYGRNFKERDITVIKPHPTGFNLSLSDIDLAVDASRPIVATLRSDADFTSANLYGETNNQQTPILSRGFYYIQLDSNVVPSHSSIVSGGVQVISNNSGPQFKNEILGLTMSKKYYFFAYANNGVGERVDGDILPFTTGGVTFTVPVVNTKQAVRISGETTGLELGGQVTNTGDSPLQTKGFWFMEFDALNMTSPTDLENYPGRGELIVNDPVDSEGNFSKIFNSISISGDYYYQAWATNLVTGLGKGLVKSTFITGNAGPTIEIIEGRLSDSITGGVTIKARIISPNGNVRSRGFYVSKKTSQQVVMLGQHATDPEIYKIDIPVNSLNQLSEFEYDTGVLGENGILALGESMHFMAFASSTGSSQSNTSVLTVKNTANTSQEPNITLESVEYLDWASPGITVNSEIGNSGWNDGSAIQSCGYYVVSRSPTYAFPTDYASRKQEILDAVENGSALTHLYEKSDGGPFGFTSNIVSGNATAIFRGTTEFPLESNKKYYFMSWANNGEKFGYSLVKCPTNRNESTGIIPTPNFRTNDGRAKEGTTQSIIMEGQITGGDTSSAVFSAGFRYVIDGVAINSPGFTTVTSSSADIAALQAYIANNSTGSSKWTFDKSGLLQGRTYKVQAWMQSTSDSNTRVYATTEATLSGDSFDGVVEITTLSPPAALPIPATPTINGISSHQARLNCGSVSKKVQGSLAISAMTPKFYYMKASDVTGSTSDQKKAYIRSNAGTTNSASGIVNAAVDFNFPPISQSDSFSLTLGDSNPSSYFGAAALPKLEPNTSYHVFCSVNNGVSLTFNGFAAGEGTSGLTTFETAISTVLPFPIDESNGNMLPGNKITISAKVGSTNTDRDWIGAYGIGFFYIKTEDLTVVTPAGVRAQGTFVASAVRRTQFYKQITLEPNKEYKWIAILTNAAGEGISAEVQTIVNGSAAVYQAPLTIRTTSGAGLWFESDGGVILNDSGTSDYNTQNIVEVMISPASADFTVFAGDWDGQYNGPRAIKTQLAGGGAAVQIIPGRNRGAQSRRARVTLTHSGDDSIKTTIAVRQEGAGVGNGNGNNSREFLL